MKVLFLDIDGVLNGYNYFDLFLDKIEKICHVKNVKKLFNRYPFGIDERRVKKLSKIIDKTNCKIVISSSWKTFLNKKNYRILPENVRKLLYLFHKYNITIYDVTPNVIFSKRREDEIIAWLAAHKKEIESFVILDDEPSELSCFVNDRLVQTSSINSNEMIKGYYKENTGLRNTHVKKAIYILNNHPINKIRKE